MKSLVSFTPICRLDWAKYPCAGDGGRSAVRVVGGHAVISSSSSSGDQPPHVSERPPMAKISPL